MYLKRAVIFGKKPYSALALKFLLDQNIIIPFVVAPVKEDYKITLSSLAKLHNIPVFSNDTQVYKMTVRNDPLAKNIDLVISYLYWKRLKMPLIRLGKLGCINFHPAPLPEYKGRAGYNTAILDNKKYFGVSAHYVDSEEFDSGPIIKVIKFKIDPDTENAHSLEAKTQKKLFELFKYIIDTTNKKTKFTVSKNSGGTYLSTPQLESLKLVDLKNDSPDIINRKIRAFFFPPYSGAKIEVKGQEYTLINEEILRYIKKQMKQ